MTNEAYRPLSARDTARDTDGVNPPGSRAASTPARVIDRLLDILIPPLCVSCHRPLVRHNALCATCWRDVHFITDPLCDQLGIPLPFDPGNRPLISAAAAARPPAYDRARAAAHYQGVVRQLIHRFKYADQHTPRHLFARWLVHTTTELVPHCNLVIPVAMHRYRLLSRRFNQSAILARDLAKHTGLTFEPNLLIRHRVTAPQVGLTRDQRRRNLQGAFSTAPHANARIEGAGILLIDDVITTGTTIEACARTLKRAGANRVDVAAIAMVSDEIPCKSIALPACSRLMLIDTKWLLPQ